MLLNRIKKNFTVKQKPIGQRPMGFCCYTSSQCNNILLYATMVLCVFREIHYMICYKKIQNSMKL